MNDDQDIPEPGLTAAPKLNETFGSIIGLVCRWLEKDGSNTLPEPERARIHALTRKVTASDEELDQLSEQIEPHAMRRVALYAALRDLRDRYEERGKYEVKP